MNRGYYDFIHGSKREIEGLTAVSPEGLVPLKAKAWLDLAEKRAAGDPIDRKAVTKHRNDVFRLFQLLSSETRVALPGFIADDLIRFLEAVAAAPPATLKPFGLGGMRVADVLAEIRSIYSLGGEGGNL